MFYFLSTASYGESYSALTALQSASLELFIRYIFLAALCHYKKKPNVYFSPFDSSSDSPISTSVISNESSLLALSSEVKKPKVMSDSLACSDWSWLASAISTEALLGLLPVALSP